MIGFWEKLIKLVCQYSVADTAYVVSIIEGVATVVAAIAAIIAVIITKRISKEQMRLATKQNEIARNQADIANQQNKIALYKERFSVYECVNKICMFGRLHKDTNSAQATDTTYHTLVLWCTSQRSNYQLSEKISFLPRNAEEQLEYETHRNDPVTIKEDYRTMKKMLANDSQVLKRGSVIFPDPIRTELEILEIAYSIYIHNHIILNISESPSNNNDLREQAQRFYSACDRFATGGLLMNLLEELSI